jgi:hypothetical protein
MRDRDLPRLARSRVVLCCVTTALLAGAVGTASATTQATPAQTAAVRVVLLRYVEALKARHFAVVCKTLTAQSQRMVIAAANPTAAKKYKTCAAAYAGTYAADGGPPVTEQLIQAVKIAKVVVHGDRAVASADGAITLLLSHGRWLISL